MTNNDTRIHQRWWWHRALTVIGLALTTTVALAIPALAHPTFSNNGPGFPNPQGSVDNPYPAGSRPTLNMFVEFEQDGVIFHGAVNTTVDVAVTLPTGWTSPACGAASTTTGNQQVGTTVPGWSCVLETTADGHQVLHWSGPQVSPTQTDADSVQYVTFQATMPSPATLTSYGAIGGPEGIHVKQVYADGTTALFTPPNDPQPGAEVAEGLVRTVAAGTPTTTKLFAGPVGLSSVPEFLVANVSPFGAAGTVVVKDGTTTITSAPLRTVVAISTAFLTPGRHSLTAQFLPAAGSPFASSSSPPIPVTILF